MTQAVSAEPGIQIYQSMSALAAETGAINLAQGVPEPLYDAEWRTAISAELPHAHFQYTPCRGTLPIRDAIERHYGLTTGNPVVTSGCTEALAAALFGLADQGCDVVVWLEPYYSYYPGLAAMAGMRARSVPIDVAGGTPLLDTDRLREALAGLGGRAVLLLNTPHNPSGLTLNGPDWAEVLRLVCDTGCHLLVDDAYRDFRYGPPAAPYADLLGTGRAAVAGSVSKSFAASGLRLGWLLAPEELAAPAERAHMHLSNCTPDLLQRAAVRLVGAIGAARLAETREHYRRKRDALLAALAAAGLRTLVPAGGHFVMAAPPRAGRSGIDLARELARAAGVAPLPLETFFDAPGRPWLRFSFAVEQDLLSTACRRLAGLRGWHG